MARDAVARRLPGGPHPDRVFDFTSGLLSRAARLRRTHRVARFGASPSVRRGASPPWRLATYLTGGAPARRLPQAAVHRGRRGCYVRSEGRAMRPADISSTKEG